MYIVTYATHKFGMFEELINNPYNLKIEVLGFGKKWNDFTDKYKGVLNFLNDKKDDDIIVFLDGFDSKINKDPSNLIETFKKFDCKLLVSKNNNLPGATQVFTTCKNGLIANTGLYMGYAKEIKIVLNETLKSMCKDDQVTFNKVCNKFDFIKIDENNLIFHNLYFYENDSDAIFIQKPAGFNKQRMFRSFKEYYQFFFITNYFSLFFLLILLPKFEKVIISLILISFLLYMYLDRSCV